MEKTLTIFVQIKHVNTKVSFVKNVYLNPILLTLSFVYQ